MLMMLIIGWAVVLPTLVVGGLLLASTVLGRRARRTGVLDVSGLARELAGLLGAEPSPVANALPAAEREPVGATY